MLGRIGDTGATQSVGAHVGWTLHRLGINLALAPSVDVNSNPDNPVIGTRSFGSEAASVAKHGAAWISGLQSMGVAACAKHFPGHGDTATDSHLSLPVVTVEKSKFKDRELLPFAAAVRSGVAAIMSSHIVVDAIDPGVPATFSSALLRGVLREELRFKGTVVSDALDMEGARLEGGIAAGALRALLAGCDLLCLGPNTTPETLEECIQVITGAVADGALSAEDLSQSARRVLELSEAFPITRPTTALEEPPLPSRRTVASTFDGVEDARAWMQEYDDFAVVRIDAMPSMAVGHVPWGPFASAAGGAHRELGSRFADAVALSPPNLPQDPPSKEPLMVIGRSLHLQPGVAQAIARWQEAGSAIMVVEMGWPANEPLVRPTLATYGASNGVGAALLDLLEQQ